MTAKLRLPTFFTGHLLVAMPQMEDPRFERSVIYLCAHNAEGAMGLVEVPLQPLGAGDLGQQLGLIGAITGCLGARQQIAE